MNFTRRTFFERAALAAAAGFMIVTGTAEMALAGKAPVFAGSTPEVAINGYDPVGYFVSQKPVKGSAKFSSSWNGAKWHFANAKNRDAFAANPEKYAPQFGGYCAFAVSYGSTASTQPEAWTIVDGKLYLNYSLGVRSRWRKDTPGFIAKANKNWPGVLK